MAAASAYPDSDFSDDDLSPTEIAFNKATGHVRTITSKLTQTQLLQIYGLYKQATEGKCNIPKPGFFNMQGRQKWEAWNSLDNLPQEEAKLKYVELVQTFDPDWEELKATTSGGAKETWVTVSSLRYSPEPELHKDKMSILEAAREDCGDQIAKLLNENPKLKFEKDEDGLTALHWAADRDAINALKAAIAGGCPLNLADESGQTALHYAASCGNVKSVQILLDAGASSNVKDSDDATPLDLAVDDDVRKLLENY